MPLTRNQRISQKFSPTQSESSSSASIINASNESKTPEPDTPLDGRSLSARLRDRRSLVSNATIKQPGAHHQPTGETHSKLQPTSPANKAAKRPSLLATPTRILPKRLCDKSDSSWARQQQPTVKQLNQPDDASADRSDHSTTSKTIEVVDLSSHEKDDDEVVEMMQSTANSDDLVQTQQQESPLTLTAQDVISKQTASTTESATTKTTAPSTVGTVNVESNSNNVDGISLLKPCPIGFQPMKLVSIVSKASDNNKSISPVRITLPSNSCANHQIHSSDGSPRKSSTPTAPDSVTKKIGVINFNNSLLRKNSTTASNGPVIINDLSKSNKSQATESDDLDEKNFNVLIAATGSVAAVKLIDLIKKLKAMFPQTFIQKTDAKNYKATISIKVLLTENAKHFVNKKQITESLNDSNIDIHDDADEWNQWTKMGDPVLHIELRKWADIMVIAPIDANTMAKISNGICDNLLTCVVRAWDVSKKLIYCPAMNVHMYNHPITREQLCKLQSFGYLRVDCIEKRLACGDVGMGAMAAVDSIADKVVENLLRPVARVSSPIKPILNQQPTYPIISTSNAATSPTKPSPTANILGRFKTNNQVTLHAVGMKQNMSRMLTYNSKSAFNGLSLPGKMKPTTMPPINLVVGKNDLLDKNRATVPSQNNHPGRPNFVTSLQNLKAINSDVTVINNDDNGVGEYDEDNDDAVNCSTPEEEAEEDGFSHDDFDPSGMMEQSLITDESIFPNDISCNLSSQLNGSSTSRASYESLGKQDNLTPLFNTQKFLALCYDETRDCFTCAICKNDYKNRKSMARHLKEQHVQGNIFQCLSCGVGYKRREKLIKHNRERHGTDQLCRSNFIVKPNKSSTMKQ